MSGADISVVMSVYNGAAKLRSSMNSILSQEGVDLEFIIVNDGSTDDSGRILDDYAERDKRVRVIHQDNQGLTRALIRGCADAQGEFIARQDVGDISLGGRLNKEVNLIRSDLDTVIVSCGTRFVGPKGENLFDVLQDSAHATSDLLALDARKLRGPSHHGSTMFRKDAYFAVGGYRHQFLIAQDIDLWVRLAERGQHAVVPEILYEAAYSLKGISAGRAVYQKKLLQIITECARLRRRNRDEGSVLIAAEALSKKARISKGSNGQSAYFLGVCLLQRDSVQARKFFGKALAENPLHFKALFRYLQTIVTNI